ncbi:hypothetical protein O1611_g6236 [Lasiodiplodia mahajangana]|uniref:Uncharacterized protein n=1 Tax=Lasiodiplodia mahajangana TaxID=1108764 RepID=A0ACC2JIR2_9PEZI|nr:hypothetical protein O1611_g6236 [Lasiodiplodia mahajangana]
MVLWIHAAQGNVSPIFRFFAAFPRTTHEEKEEEEEEEEEEERDKQAKETLELPLPSPPPKGHTALSGARAAVVDSSSVTEDAHLAKVIQSHIHHTYPSAHVLGQPGIAAYTYGQSALRVNQSLIFAPSDEPGAADLVITRDSSRTCSRRDVMMEADQPSFKRTDDDDDDDDDDEMGRQTMDRAQTLPLWLPNPPNQGDETFLY